MDITVRTMTGEDWEAVTGIYQEGINTKTATFQAEVPSYEVWDHSHIPSCRLVAEHDGAVVGWAALSPYSSRCVYSGVAEVSIYIKEGYRGNKVGERLLKTLIAGAEAEGFWTLQSGIIEINRASVALHEKAGFRLVGYRERIAKDLNGVWQNTLLMERRSNVL